MYHVTLSPSVVCKICSHTLHSAIASAIDLVRQNASPPHFPNDVFFLSHIVRARINDFHPFGWSASSAVLFLFLFFGLFKWNISDTRQWWRRRRHKITISFFYDSLIKKRMEKTIMMMLIMMTKCQCLHYFSFRQLPSSSPVFLSWDFCERRFILFSDRMLHVFADNDEVDGMIGTFFWFLCSVCIFAMKNAMLLV